MNRPYRRRSGKGHRARPACPSEKSRSPFTNVRYSICLRRARQACPSGRFLGGTCLSGPPFDVGSSIAPSSGTTSVPLRKILQVPPG
ncbi:hypothetical protein THTE_0294 [Thermogutta terrifontis]|uniref:Uncharacterized protein n=1 Tax=Thermogutta terrifontis TaxID=1331910 RepID=A0A286RAA4_9BACT|nr:hypothetical protein THTE_0294 [Thermogutta terrifontis]